MKMDSLDLLAREDEFKKLNKQLEKRTESLMKEIECAMQKPDIFSDFSHNLSLTPTHTTKKHLCSPPKQDTVTTPPIHNESVRKKVQKSSNNKVVEQKVTTTENDEILSSDNVKRVICDCCIVNSNPKRSDNDEFLHAFVSVSVQDNVMPKSFLKETLSIESICKFLTSKVKLLQEQIDVMQATIDKKATQCKSHLTHQAELEGERLSILNKNNNLRAAATDAKAKAAASELKLAEKDRLYKEQRSECDRLSCELKRLRTEYASMCGRQAAQSEQIATLSQQLKVAKAEHMEFRDSTRALSASNQTAISTLDAKIKALNSTIDKQSSLIDNLRRQNAILGTEGAIRALEKEYSNLLSQDL